MMDGLHFILLQEIAIWTCANSLLTKLKTRILLTTMKEPQKILLKEEKMDGKLFSYLNHIIFEPKLRNLGLPDSLLLDIFTAA